jgi:hypothetical protein
MEMQIRDEPLVGYINLFYLIEEMRGIGVGIPERKRTRGV